MNNNFRFPGQYFDAETGLNYNYFRTYDATLGRYTQSDPIGLNGGLNVFGYVGGRPVDMLDSRGLVSLTCKTKSTAIAPGEDASYDKQGRKWCAIRCFDNNNKANVKDFIAPNDGGQFCHGQRGGDEYSHLIYNAFIFNSECPYHTWNLGIGFTDAVGKAFGE